MSLTAEIQAKATQKAQRQALWLQPNHAETVTMSVEDERLKETVSAIIIHTSNVDMRDNNVAHFRIFLQLPGNSSVQLDSYGLQGLQTKLRISYHPFQFSTSARMMEILRVPVKGSFTVLDVVTTLLTNNRDRYNLEPGSGSGCRYWCHVVIADFISNGWVDPALANCVEELTTALKANEKFKDINIPIPAPQGSFY